MHEQLYAVANKHKARGETAFEQQQVRARARPVRVRARCTAALATCVSPACVHTQPRTPLQWQAAVAEFSTALKWATDGSAGGEADLRARRAAALCR